MIFPSEFSATLVKFKSRFKKVTNSDVDLVQMTADLEYVLKIFIEAKSSEDYELSILVDNLFENIDPQGSDAAKQLKIKKLREELGFGASKSDGTIRGQHSIVMLHELAEDNEKNSNLEFLEYKKTLSDQYLEILDDLNEKSMDSWSIR